MMTDISEGYIWQSLYDHCQKFRPRSCLAHTGCILVSPKIEEIVAAEASRSTKAEGEMWNSMS